MWKLTGGPCITLEFILLTRVVNGKIVEGKKSGVSAETYDRHE